MFIEPFAPLEPHVLNILTPRIRRFDQHEKATVGPYRLSDERL
jgi:hypothetical protein